MSARIHTVSATEFTDLTKPGRIAFLAEVAGEYLATTGRGKNRKATLDAMPATYVPLFERRVRQAARLANGGNKPSEQQVEALRASVLAKAATAQEGAKA